MTYSRTAASALLVTGLSLAPLSSASAQWCGWQCDPLTWPFVAVGAALAGAAFIVTAPFRTSRRLRHTITTRQLAVTDRRCLIRRRRAIPGSPVTQHLLKRTSPANTM
jgi:hypothetical protein